VNGQVALLVVLIIVVLVALPVYAAVLSASVYAGKVFAVRRLFHTTHQEDTENGQADEGS